MAEYVDYEMWFGTFEGEDFVWKMLKKSDRYDEIYKYYKNFVIEQMKHDAEELEDIWGCGRLDIKIQQGNKTLAWVGIHATKVSKEDEEEEKSKKDSVGDSLDIPSPYKWYFYCVGENNLCEWSEKDMLLRHIIMPEDIMTNLTPIQRDADRRMRIIARKLEDYIKNLPDEVVGDFRGTTNTLRFERIFARDVDGNLIHFDDLLVTIKL